MASMQKFLVSSILITFLFSPVSAFAQNKIFNVRYWAAPDHTRIVIDASDDVPYTVKKTEKKLLINFKDTEIPEDFPQEIIVQKPGIEKITAIPLPDGAVGIELSIAQNVETRVFTIIKFQDKPYRVVVDIELPDVEKQEGQEREQIKALRKDKIIVIDPGHGGEDPGAVGKLKTQEKKVVLGISKKLRDILNKKKGYRAFLTRNGDYYVSFKKRLKIAREYGADLFVSIHADAFRKRNARGSSVYCLSLRRASSEAARILARNENLADIMGGSPNGENSDEVDPIILNMFQTNTLNSSKIFGSAVIKHLDSVNHIKYRKVQEAPLIVLKLPEIPSLLVETAYISNLKEEKLLRSNRFQTEIAKALANSITDFLPVKPVPPSKTPKIVLTKNEDKKTSIDREAKQQSMPIEQGEEKLDENKALTKKQPLPKKELKTIDEARKTKTRTAVYQVKRGDTLEKIAIKNNTEISTLLKLNHMKLYDNLHAGRKLKVPVFRANNTEEKNKKDNASVDRSEAPSPSTDTAVRVYRVKKGDSLDRIAKKNNTTLSILLKMNNMKMKEPLYVGKKVKVPDTENAREEVKKSTDKKSAKSYVYRVRKGDTLDKIAKRCNTSVSELRRLNKIKHADVVYVNQKLKLPSNPSI